MAAMTALPQRPVTRSAYLAFERVAEERHQLWDGEVFPMVAASLAHERLVRNLLVELTAGLRDRGCEPLPSNLRVRIPNGDRYVYPDVSVVCGEPHFEDEHQDVLENPRAIIEVLSPSTERFDRGEKFAGYRAIGTLEHYVLVAQDRRGVEHFRRQRDGTWILRAIEDGELALDSLDVVLPLDAIYRGV